MPHKSANLGRTPEEEPSRHQTKVNSTLSRSNSSNSLTLAKEVPLEHPRAIAIMVMEQEAMQLEVKAWLEDCPLLPPPSITTETRSQAKCSTTHKARQTNQAASVVLLSTSSPCMAVTHLLTSTRCMEVWRQVTTSHGCRVPQVSNLWPARVLVGSQLTVPNLQWEDPVLHLSSRHSPSSRLYQAVKQDRCRRLRGHLLLALTAVDLQDLMGLPMTVATCMNSTNNLLVLHSLTIFKKAK